MELSWSEIIGESLKILDGREACPQTELNICL